jgi:hypothetical protein
MTNEDKPIDLATEVVKKINEDSRAPGTFRKHVFGTPVLTDEEYAARKRQLMEYNAKDLDPVDANSVIIDAADLLAKMRFNSRFPLHSSRFVPFYSSARKDEISAAGKAALAGDMLDWLERPMPVSEYEPPGIQTRPMPIRILGETEVRLMVTAAKRMDNRSARQDRKFVKQLLSRSPSSDVSALQERASSTLRGRFTHRHKGAKPKRGNPWRPTQ